MQRKPDIKDGGHSCVEIAATANSLFLNNFEKWVAASIVCSEKGLDAGQRIKNIRDSYQNAIKGNIEYHSNMIDVEKSYGNNNDAAAIHHAMAQAYRALVLDDVIEI